MPFSIQQEPGQRIIVGSLTRDFDIYREIYAYINTLKDTLDGMDGPSVHVADVHSFAINMGDLTSVLGRLTRSDMNVVHHPKLVRTFVVSPSSMIRLWLTGAGQKHGAIRATVVTTLDE